MKTLTKVSATRVFRALSDPTRLRILCLLLSGELCVCDIVNTLRVSQPMVSRHLAYLKRSGLVESRRDGLWMHYQMSRPQSEIHERIVACLEACRQDDAQLTKDAARIQRRCC